MDLYTRVAYQTSRHLTLAYSTSFGISSKLFSASIRPHIYAVYGLVRVADEIVDTYTGTDQRELLDALELETYTAIKTGYSTNLIVHAFALTARQYGITKTIIAPFFTSMRMDLSPQTYTEKLYKTYIYGSAEVIGLMCLRVFCSGNDTQYESLREGAQALGAAYQKVNFLRDLASDSQSLNRMYFPGTTFASFDEAAKKAIIDDIEKDIRLAKESLARLPKSSRVAVSTSLSYYSTLLEKLRHTSAERIKQKRVRVNNAHKLALLVKTIAKESTQS